MRRKIAVLYAHPDIEVLHGYDGAVDTWMDDEGVGHVFLKPGGSYYLSEEPDWDRAGEMGLVV